jgi:UDP-N-acetylglucosamine--N-acetylmuramyl-(pentapeptide) pyrophosphoryl-undecaprenol N-acetylglucosamine transferase
LAAAIRDEQTANAKGLVDAQAAVLMPEDSFHVDTLSAQIQFILTQPEAASQMARNALSVGVPDATHRLIALIETLISKET